QAIGEDPQDAHRDSQGADERPFEQPNLQPGPKQHPAVQQHHPAEMRLAYLNDTLAGEQTLVAPRQSHLNQPAHANRSQQHTVTDCAHTHCKSSNSVLSPGPNPAINPYTPGLSRRLVNQSRSTNRIVALDKLPYSRRTSQDGCTFSRSMLSSCSK